MADPKPSHPNGIPNGVGSQNPKFSRPFSLYEALPYSPFTSILPFEPDMIPAATLGSGLPSSNLAGLVSRREFDTLNKAAAQSTNPNYLEPSLEHVEHLLSPKKLTQFTFKAVPKVGSGGALSSRIAGNLSPVAKMIYENANVSYRYPTPDTPQPGVTNGQMTPTTAKQRSPLVKKAETPRPGSSASINKQSHAKNSSNFEILLPSKQQVEAANAALNHPARQTLLAPPSVSLPAQAQAQTPTSKLKPTPVYKNDQALVPSPLRPDPLLGDTPIVTPTKVPVQKEPASGPPSSMMTVELTPSAKFNRNEYQFVPDVLDAPQNLSARKSQADGYDNSQEIYGGLDQRQRADAAFQELRRTFQDIFEAEENMAGQSVALPMIALTNDEEPTLTIAAHQKVHSQIQKATTLGCFGLVPVDDLIRLQRLGDGSLRHAASLGELKVTETWGEAEVDIWAQKLPDVDAGLKAARTSLRIMCGGREDRQLYSEDIIQSAVDLFRNVVDGIVVPVTELRNSGTTERLFKQLSLHKKTITTVFTSCQRLFALMASLTTAIDLSEMVITTLEFTASSLIFAENAHTERESVLGVQKFDGLRLVAMDMLSQIFLMNPNQRQGIFDGILTSLEKLPVGKQNARQFKLVDGRSIQPVSALIMRLVQASAGKVDDNKSKARESALKTLEDQDQDELADGEPNGGRNTAHSLATITSEERGAAQHATATQELDNLVSPLIHTAARNASYVVNVIVSRALTSSKSGDDPYRNLLDLFVEDFTACLDSPDWPAAELLLRLLMSKMVKLVEGEKQSAPSKNMALEILGVLGAAISKLRSHVRKSANSIDSIDPGELSSYLSELAVSALEHKSRPELMAAWSGPYRAGLEYLKGRCSEDPHLSSAVSYMITDWASKVCAAYDSYKEDDDSERDEELGRLAYRLRMMIEDRRWLSNEFSFNAVSSNQAKLSHAVTLVRSPLCESFNAILNILLSSVVGDQATVRSKSLKSITQLMETDPSILDGNSIVVQLILQCSSDSSTQVRDSALSLIGKAIGLRPALEEQMIPTVIQRFLDAGVGVRKRSMKLAKDIYLHNNNKVVRSAIANGLLHRVQDPDEGVRVYARQTIEEIWIYPFYNGEGTAAYKTSLDDHVSLMVQTVKSGSVTPVLDKVLQTILSPESKTAKQNAEVCKRLVAGMFDLVDNPDSDDPSLPSGRDALQVLMIFAKADASLFTFEQIRLLKPHIETVGKSEDMAVSRATVVIYRRVLPHLSSVHSQFLSDVRTSLLKAVAKLARLLLDDVVACLWIISTLLDNADHVGRLASSALVALQKMRTRIYNKQPFEELMIRQFGQYSLIVGMAGKHCNLDRCQDVFKDKFPKWSGNSVSQLIIDILIPFTQAGLSLEMRKSALDGVGLVCQSWPRNYVSPNVYAAFQEVFKEKNAILEAIIMRSLKEFLAIEEKRSETASEAAKASKSGGSDAEKKRELTIIGGTNHDDVASATTQRFIDDFTRIALATLDDHAFLAAEVLGSINRQGLVHPKETGVTMMTLETSPVAKMSELAFHEHRAMHGKYETVLEREYVKTIQSAFQYQRDIVKDTHGATTNPFSSKLHLLMEVLKDSRSKNRQRLLDKMCAQVDFEPGKLDVSQVIPYHVEFSRFIIDNLAFFEYITVGELQNTVNMMEKTVHSTGATIAHAIESDVFRVRMDIEPSFQLMIEGEDVAAPPVQPPVDPYRFRQLTAGSMILSYLWEARTHLRRLYNIRREKGKAAAKDLSKAPIKAQGVTGDKFWEDSATIIAALASPEHMMEQCKSFVELLNVDKEFKVADEDEDINGQDPHTPSGDEEDADGRGRKRKASNTPGSRKKRARSSSVTRKRGRPRKNPVPEEDADADADFDDEDMEWI